MKFFICYRTICSNDRPRLLEWLKGLDPGLKRRIIMRINFIALLVGITFLNVCATVKAQRISITANQAPLTEILEQIKKQSGYQFLYDKAQIAAAKPVTINLEKAELKQVLSLCFEQQLALSYEIIGKTIVIKLRERSLMERVTNFIKSIKITGQVANEQGKPMAGVTIKVKGKATTAISSSDGEYQIETGAGDILVFSYVGYESKEISVSDQSKINIVMKESNGQLDQIQVIGYGTTTKRLSTGNVGTIRAEVIALQPVTNPLIALQGRVPGLQITQTSGLPGAAVKVQIRGRNSIAANNNPLYVIDGVPFTSSPLERIVGINTPGGGDTNYSSPLNTISPNDIESIDILKDADATAIYGSRAANGVVLITTKKGKSGKLKVDATVKYGVGEVTRMAKMLNTQQYLQFRRDAFANSGIVTTANNAPELFTWDQNADYNWQDWYIGGTAKATDASVSVSGGSELLTFLVSGSYHKEGTVLPGSNHYIRGGFHTSTQYRSQDRRFGMTTNLFFNRDDNKLSGAASGQPLFANIIRQAPNFPTYDPNGKYNWEAGKANWVAQTEATNVNKTDNLNASLNLHYTFDNGISLKADAGYNNIQVFQNNRTPSVAQVPVLASLFGATSDFANNSIKTYLFEPQISFGSQIGAGKLQALAGATLQRMDSNGQTINLQNYTNDLLLGNMAFGTVNRQSSTNVQYNFLSLFGRLTYNWKDRYILNITGRRDGSTRFGPGKQFGNFGSIGAVWIFSSETLFKDNLPWLSFGKLRASYGTTGNDGIGDYGYLSLYASALVYGNTIAIQPNQIGNQNYQWELNKKLESSIDLGFSKDRILFTATWYRNRSGNQLVGYPLPSITGFTSYNANLGAIVQNSGWEFDLNTKNVNAGMFKLESSINITIPSNKLVSFPNLDQTSYAQSLVVGKPLDIMLAYHYTGVDPTNGNPTVQDVNGDNRIVSSSSYNNVGGDYLIVGKTAPGWYGGLNNSFKFKNWQLDCFFLYTKQQGFNTYKWSGNFGSGTTTNVWTDALSYWRAQGDHTQVQKPLAQTTSLQFLFNGSDIGVSDASFLRLKTLSLAYHLPVGVLSRLKISDVKFFIQGQNLVTITNLKGYDPENSNLASLSIPTLRQWSGGIQCTF